MESENQKTAIGDIPGFPNYYITQGGEIWHIKTKRKVSRLCSPEGCKVRLYYKPVSGRELLKTFTIHRLMAYAFHGLSEKDFFGVNHLDGNRENNALSNLQIVFPESIESDHQFDGIWKDIPGFSRYQACTDGRIMSKARWQTNQYGIAIYHPPKLIKLIDKGLKYQSVIIYSDEGARAGQLVHRLIMQTFSPIEGEYQVNHINGNKQDNRLENLQWCTQEENLQHARDSGLYKCGEESVTAKLTDAQAVEIRSRFAAGDISKGALSREYKVSRKAIAELLSGKTWKHLL